MGREPAESKSKDVLRTLCSAQEDGMRKSRLQNAPWNGLLLLAMAVTPAFAEEYGGGTLVPSIEWKRSYREAVDEADRDGKPILVTVTASWCGPCRQLKQLTFRDSRVTELVRNDFVALSIDADEHPDLVTGFRGQFNFGTEFDIENAHDVSNCK